MDKTEDGGADVDKQVSDQSTDDKGGDDSQVKSEKTVSWDDHQRAIRDMHKFKTELKDMKEKESSNESERLREKEDFKTLSERQQVEITDLKSTNENIFKSIETAEKFKAVRESALKAGIKDNALNMLDNLDLKGVIAEKTDQGRMIVHGADDFINSLKKDSDFMFKDTKVPNFNGGGGTPPQSTPSEMTAQQFVKFEREFRGQPQKLKELREKYTNQLRREQSRR